MTTKQARDLCTLFGVNPDEAVGEEPRDIAVQRIFDANAADKALEEHNEKWTPKPERPINTGKPARTLLPLKGGAK